MLSRPFVDEGLGNSSELIPSEESGLAAEGQTSVWGS